MAVTLPPVLVDEIIDFLVTRPTPEEIIGFHPSDQLAKRAAELLELNRGNRLGDEDRAEMEDFMRMEHFMTQLKARARLKLQAGS
jgi:hypothetical protein